MMKKLVGKKEKEVKLVVVDRGGVHSTSWLWKTESSSWLVTSKCKKGSVNYSEAIPSGMPKGRGRKGKHLGIAKLLNSLWTYREYLLKIRNKFNQLHHSINTSPSTKHTTYHTTITSNISYTTISITDRKSSGNDKLRKKPASKTSLSVASTKYLHFIFPALLSTRHLLLTLCFLTYPPPLKLSQTYTGTHLLTGDTYIECWPYSNSKITW
jgi:hypothetical protein